MSAGAALEEAALGGPTGSHGGSWRWLLVVGVSALAREMADRCREERIGLVEEATLVELTETAGTMTAIAFIGSWRSRRRPVWVHCVLPSSVKALRRCASVLELLLTRARDAGCSFILEGLTTPQVWQHELARRVRAASTTVLFRDPVSTRRTRLWRLCSRAAGLRKALWQREPPGVERGRGRGLRGLRRRGRS